MSERQAEYSVRTTVTLTRDLANRLHLAATTSGQSASALVRDALQRYLADQAPPRLPSFTGIAAGGGRPFDLDEEIGKAIEEHYEQDMGGSPRRRKRAH